MPQGITHSGVVTFHELAPRLTRIEVNLDIDPGSLIEKAARGMRHVKRAVRADLARFKAFIEMQELETGAWRGVIEDGEVVEPHDDSYDEERDYSEVDDLYDDGSTTTTDDDDQDEDEEEEEDEPADSATLRADERSSGGSRSSSGSAASPSRARRGRAPSKSGSSRARVEVRLVESGGPSRSSGSSQPREWVQDGRRVSGSKSPRSSGSKSGLRSRASSSGKSCELVARSEQRNGSSSSGARSGARPAAGAAMSGALESSPSECRADRLARPRRPGGGARRGRRCAITYRLVRS